MSETSMAEFRLSSQGSQWVLLGTYSFAGGGHIVEIHNGQSTPGSYVIADAVKFVRIGP